MLPPHSYLLVFPNFAAVNLLFKENAVTYNILVSEKCRRALIQRA